MSTWVVSLFDAVERAWRSSRTRSILIRGLLSQSADAQVIEPAGWVLLSASLTHALLLWMAPIYVRPFYGVAGALAPAAVAVALIAMKWGRVHFSGPVRD